LSSTDPTSSELSSSDPLQLGREYYWVGQFKAAIQQWQQELQHQGENQLQQALTLSYLALAYQKLGEWQQAEQAIERASGLVQTSAEAKSEQRSVLAQVLNTQGRVQLGMGRSEAALASWQQAEQQYRAIGDGEGELGSRINQAQALQTLGLYRRAQTLLQEINAMLQTQPDSLLKALGLSSLGSVLQMTGNLDTSEQLLRQSLAITQQLGLNNQIAETQFSLANTLRSQQKTADALQLYQQVATTTTTPIALKAQLNQLSLLIETQQWPEAEALAIELQPQFAKLSPSRDAIYAQVNFIVYSLRMIRQTSTNHASLSIQNLAQLLANAIEQAQILQDPRAESYAIGELGALYESTQQWQIAQSLTQEALLLAQSANAADVAYRWQWQLGRLLKQQGSLQRGATIAAYTEALTTLNAIRRDLLATNPEFQFSFREAVEPVYRELVDLLVVPGVSPTELEQARAAIESLRLAELENFFRSACLDPVEQIDFIDDQAAIFYPILLNDRLIVILSLPGQPLQYHTAPVPLSQIETVANEFRRNLILPYTAATDFQPLAQQLYAWIVQPVISILTERQIETLVFVQDGILQNIPMSALYDGQQYLIERFNIAHTPGLRLFEPKSVTQIALNAVTAGLTEPRHSFESLKFVEMELAQIRSKISTEILLNQSFTSTSLSDRLADSPAPIVHIATHGQFSSQLDQTFILAWDQPITVDRFNQLLRSRQGRDNELELLVLSACETAAGDQRAALGLAGVAVQAGARSTLASLWLIDDESTPLLMTEFYQGLKTGQSKAAALRQAQLKLLSGQYNHPRYWAAFVLLGNWR
jgi:CHAT domain-containing protein